MVYLLKMVIFHGYVKEPEGTNWYDVSAVTSLPRFCTGCDRAPVGGLGPTSQRMLCTFVVEMYTYDMYCVYLGKL